jgi:glycerol-3-phosphate dehydrogenase
MSKSESFDVLVIGGGIHGTGVAQAAAAGGYRVALLEKSGLAAGTSSRSSKLIHGGLRYLESREFSLVRESLRERELLLRLAPKLVRRQKFFVPVYRHTSRRAWWIASGLGLYAILAGGSRYTRFHRVEKEAWSALDGLQTDDLQAVLQYWDAQTDDAGLTRAVMHSARAHGAELFCPASFVSANISADGVYFRYQQDGSVHEGFAATVVNAAGPWASSILSSFEPTQRPLAVENVQGTHVELPAKVEQGCYYLEVPSDKRAVFVMPWKGHSLLGTTERIYTGEPDEVVPLEAEKEYLLEVYRQYFPGHSTKILDSWAGLRVLPAATGEAFKRSRETQLPVDNITRPRLVTIFGGKLTGYRATAEKVMKVLSRTLPDRTPVASTRDLHLTIDPA